MRKSAVEAENKIDCAPKPIVLDRKFRSDRNSKLTRRLETLRR